MFRFSFISLFLLILVACAADQTPPAAISAGNDARPVVLVIGDSLSAAYGIDPQEGWVSLLQERLDAQGLYYNVVNASVSGDTTAGGLVRLKSALPRYQPAAVIIELGGNDGLRAIGLPVIKKNLNAMIEISQAAGASVALMGMRIPTNYGQRYADSFHDLYKDAAMRYDVPLVEFFMDGVALDRSLMLADGIHPNAKAQPKLLYNAWPAIEQALLLR